MSNIIPRTLNQFIPLLPLLGVVGLGFFVTLLNKVGIPRHLEAERHVLFQPFKEC